MLAGARPLLDRFAGTGQSMGQSRPVKDKAALQNIRQKWLLQNKEDSQVRESSLLFYFWFSTLSAA